VFTVEFVMRGYITGSTGTSLWTNYAKGVRQYCGELLEIQNHSP
jgi:phosphoribosylaminoimidazole-succinocarboxamide synthase